MKYLQTIYQGWVSHGTKLIGFAQGTIAALCGVTGVIPEHHLKYYLAGSAVLTFWRGFFNDAQRDRS